jgi:hypothetical protein
MYYEERIPVPDGWGAVPRGYLQFRPPYGSRAQDALERGWVVDHLPGLHLYQIMDPDAVPGRIVAMVDRWHPGPAEPGV